MTTTAVIVPTARRPANARRLATAFRDTATGNHTHLIFAADSDDPDLPAYRAVQRDCPWVSLRVIPGSPHRIGPIVNAVAADLLRSRPLLAAAGLIGFMGDDHLPQTPGWDTLLAGELDGRAGVAYGNDLHQRQKLPTACLISASLIAAMGYMVPPSLGHLFLDDFWLRLGYVTHLAYRDDVIIEHLHPDAGKAPHDAVYAAAGRNAEVWARDDNAFEAYLREGGGWDQAVARIAHLRQVPGAV